MLGALQNRQPELSAVRVNVRPTTYWSSFWRSEFRLADEQLSQPLRFRLGELFAVVTAAAVLLALFRSLGIIGAALSFIAAVAFTNVVYPKWSAASLARQETMFDFVWGLVMPVVCLAFDPFVFKENNFMFPDDFLDVPAIHWTGGRLYPYSIPAYGFIGWQLVVLGIWLIAGRLSADLSAVWAGMLWSGFMVGCIIGGVLFVPALIGVLFAGVGLLGLTPLFTARAYFRRGLLAAAIAARELSPRRAELLALTGYWLALPIPALGLLMVWTLLFGR